MPSRFDRDNIYSCLENMIANGDFYFEKHYLSVFIVMYRGLLIHAFLNVL